MRTIIPWVLRILVFSILFWFGHILGVSFDPRFFLPADELASSQAIENNSVQHNHLLIIVEKITIQPKIVSIWLVGNRFNMPTQMVMLYPSKSASLPLANNFAAEFALQGFWKKREIRPEFLKILADQGIQYSHYFVIDQAVVNAIQFDFKINSEENARPLSTSFDNSIENQLDTWQRICSAALETPGGLNLNKLNLDLKLHAVSQTGSNNMTIIPANPSFSSCFDRTEPRSEALLQPIHP